MAHDSRNALTPDALAMMDIIARTGSFAAAARELGKVPSALTYSVRQLEEALESFPGTALLVTHDRRMLDTVRLTRRWHVEDGRVNEIDPG